VFDPSRSAVIVVDMQNDFGSDGGMFQRAGINVAPIKAIIPRIGQVLGAARAAGMPIVFLKQQHRPDLRDAGGPSAPHFLKHQPLHIGERVTAPDGSVSRILVADTWNTDIVDELTPEPSDLVVGKHRYSGFFETPLHERLTGLNVDTLVFVGATTSICVESTVRDAMFLDYTCIVLSDCTAEPIANEAPRSNHEASLLNIELLFGWVADSEALLAALNASEPSAAAKPAFVDD
jgi:ureidoacrylate peracid hydrolase